ncbi:hypothetical protein VTL71DRAFT_12039 [Oculimacula yallundae]|uniref:F-box domain-containing protein n=1 Tax=Oculimacula yallundae TaxID=86028 RepID=A0ABR4CTE8_9HELO
MASPTSAVSCPILGSDVLALILDELFDEVPSKEFFSLACVHISFYEGIKRFRGRYQTFHFGRIPGPYNARVTRKRIQSYLDAPVKLSIVPNIRHITVTSSHESEEDEEYGRPCLGGFKVDGKWVELLSLVAAIPRLKSLVFKAFEPMPSCLVHRLEQCHPQARLEIHNWTRHTDDADHMDPCEIALAHSINLRSLHADLWTSSSIIDLRISALKRIVAIAPNLDEVKIRGENSTTMGFLSVWAPPLLPDVREKKTLFELHGRPKRFLQSVELSGSEYLSVLDDIVDYSSLQKLHIDQFQAVRFHHHEAEDMDLLLCTNLSSLQHLTVVLPEVTNNMNHIAHAGPVAEFMLNCKHLETLEITESAAYDLNLDGIIKYHGESLKRFVLVGNTNSLLQGAACPLTILETIQAFCPSLEYIGIDAHTGEDVSFDTTGFRVLAQIPELKVLHLRCSFPFTTDQGSNDESIEDFMYAEDYGHRFRASYGNWIVSLWNFLQARRKENGFRSIREVHLTYPEHIRTSLGPRKFAMDVVRASERDDRPDEIRIEGKVPGFKGLQRRNLKLSVV